jgi:hypothetical protein
VVSEEAAGEVRMRERPTVTSALGDGAALGWMAQDGDESVSRHRPKHPTPVLEIRSYPNAG